MFDFTSKPFFDNHTHRIDVRNREITPLELGIAFVHGWGPVNYAKDLPLGSAGISNCDPEYEVHVMNMGVVKVLVNRLALKYGCPADVNAVVRERNKRTAADGYGYAKSLYEEANIIGEVVDDGAPFGDPALDCFPTKIYRLFQMDGFVRKLIKTTDSFTKAKEAFDRGVKERLAEGFIGLQSHVFELCSMKLRVVEDAEAEGCFEAAKNGDGCAFEVVYLALFEHALVMTQELGFTVHIHTGCTGNPNDLKNNTDPYAIEPILRDHRYYAARIVFLHGNPPDFGRAAWVCHGYPNVWMDLGWSLPWLSMNMDAIFEEVLSMAPHSKIMLGTGQHDHAEMSWLAARIAKSALARVMDRQVERGLLSAEQAEETADQLLYKNALRLYGIGHE